jgi:indolepyruvate ferredoxin oxidoreductase beta subunit
VSGLLRLRALAALRRWRPRSLRWAEEQAEMEAWLGRVNRALEAGQPILALEIVGCATLLKGYAETHRRGRRGFALVMERVVDPALAAPVPEAAGRVARAREAALADPEHKALETVLARIAAEAAAPTLAQAAE